MATKIKMPKISANVEEEAITGWLKHEGEEVSKGEPLLEVTTDKAVVEVESPASGIVRKILAGEKSMLPVGYVVAIIGKPNEALPDVMSYNKGLLDKLRRSAGKKGGNNARPAAAKKSDGGAVPATPKARKLARSLGVDLAQVQARTGTRVVNEAAVREFAG